MRNRKKYVVESEGNERRDKKRERGDREVPYVEIKEWDEE